MSAGDQQFLFVITAFNVRPFLGALVASLAFQRLSAWKAVLVDDASTDGTLDTLRSLLDAHGISAKFEIIANPERRYKASNVYSALQGRGAPEEIVVMLDGDDHLAADDALDRLAREYDQGWEVVWSNWRGSDGSRGTSSHLNPFVSPRRQAFVSSHLFSFRRRLFDAVVESDLQDDSGQWLQAGVDVAIAWPILDQTIKRKFTDEVLCIYNRANPLSHDNVEGPVRAYVGRAQAATSKMLSRRPGKPLTIDHQFLHAHLYELMQAAMVSLRVAVRQEIAARPTTSPSPPPSPG